MTDYDIAEAMTRYGGSFVHVLGKAFRAADDDNRLRIKTAFPEYWAEYAEVAKMHADRVAAAAIPPTGRQG